MIQNNRFDRCPEIQALVTWPKPPQKVKFLILCLYSISSNLGFPSGVKRQISTLCSSHPARPFTITHVCSMGWNLAFPPRTSHWVCLETGGGHSTLNPPPWQAPPCLLYINMCPLSECMFPQTRLRALLWTWTGSYPSFCLPQCMAHSEHKTCLNPWPLFDLPSGEMSWFASSYHCQVRVHWGSSRKR